MFPLLQLSNNNFAPFSDFMGSNYTRIDSFILAILLECLVSTSTAILVMHSDICANF